MTAPFKPGAIVRFRYSADKKDRFRVIACHPWHGVASGWLVSLAPPGLSRVDSNDLRLAVVK